MGRLSPGSTAPAAAVALAPPCAPGRVPSAAEELALLVIGLDAGGFVHWTACGMAPGTPGRGELIGRDGRGA